MIIGIVQARMSSRRLPGKVMKTVLDKPLIGYLLERLKYVKNLDKIVVATSTDPSNDLLCEYVSQQGIEVFRGSEDDVLDRYYQVACKYKAKVVVRLTADCPLLDPGVVSKVIAYFETHDCDYVSNGHPPTFPDGLDVEVFSFEVLKEAWECAELKSEREHVTPYIVHSDKFNMGNVALKTDLSGERWTVDEPEDFLLIKSIIENLYVKNPTFDMNDILEYKKNNLEIFEINQHIVPNEGYFYSLKNDYKVERRTVK